MSFGLGFGFPGTVAAGSGATLALQFAGATALDPRITFTRASSATFTNSAGLVALSPINLLTYSEQFDNAAWTKNLASVTSDVTASPSGIVDADKIIEAVGVSDHSVYRNPTLLVNTTYTFSIFAKANTRTKIGIALGFTAYGGISVRAHFNLITGTFITSANSPEAYSIVDVGNNWYKISITKTTSVAGNGSVAVYTLDESGAFTYNGDGTSGLYIWGAQLEAGSTATTYIPTVATATGAARFDYDPVTLQPKGLLIEEARTNVILYSGAISVANGWATDAVSTLATNQAIAPDGTLTASQLQFISNTYIYQNKTVTTATAYTWSVYAKLGTGGDGTVRLDHQTGAGYFSSTFNLLTGVVVSGTGVIQNVGNGWYRCLLTYTTTSTNDLIDFVMLGTFTAGQGHYIWGAQLEAGSGATSYIPTVASQVTRAAENAVMTGTNFSSWYNQTEGTLYSSGAALSVTSPTNRHISAFELDNANYITLTVNTVGQLLSNGQASGVSQWAIVNSTVITANQNFKVSVAFKINDIALVYNALTPVTDTNAVIPVPTQLGIGKLPFAGQYFNGTIASITYWPRRLSNAELQAVTR